MDRSCSTKERIANARAPADPRTALATEAVVLGVVGFAHSATRASWMAPKIAYRTCAGEDSASLRGT